MKNLFRFLLSIMPVCFAAHAQAGIRCQLVYNNQVEQAQIFRTIEALSKRPKNATENSRAQLLDTAAALLERFSIELVDLKGELARFDGKTLFIDKKVPQTFKRSATGQSYPLQGMLAVAAVVEKAGAGIGLPIQSQKVLGRQILNIFLDDLKIPAKDVETVLSQAFQNPIEIGVAAKEMIRITDEVFSLIELDTRFQIPYLAGYAHDNPRRIYIDQNIERIQTFEGEKGSNIIDVYKSLAIHEAIEKSLIDLLQFEQASYLRTHQIAQRLEKAYVDAQAVSWEKYQKFAMGREIERAEVQALLRVPTDLDLTPYRDYQDVDLIAKMKSMYVQPVKVHPTQSNFEVVNILPGIIWLKFNAKETLAKTMLRFQEFYESPEFADKTFTLEQFVRWYKKQRNGVFDYYQEWDGFNFPAQVLESFYLGQFKNLSPEELGVLNALKFRMHTKQYVIATAGDSGVNTLKHEIAHGFYSLSPRYKAEVDAVIASLPPQLDKALEKYLLDEVGQYHQKVIRDEKHAWLMHDSPYMQEHGFDTRPYEPYIKQLQRIYARYAPESLQSEP